MCRRPVQTWLVPPEHPRLLRSCSPCFAPPVPPSLWARAVRYAVVHYACSRHSRHGEAMEETDWIDRTRYPFDLDIHRRYEVAEGSGTPLVMVVVVWSE